MLLLDGSGIPKKLLNESGIPEDVKQDECTSVRIFAFLKAHKCGSTTVQNILFRYSVKQSLNVVLPEKGVKYELNFLEINFINIPYYKGNNIDFNPKEALDFRRPLLQHGLDYSVFCLHVPEGWNHTQVGGLIGDQGGGNAKYFSILRDPVDLFVSIWDYFGFSRAYRMDLESFATKTSNDFKERTDRRTKGQAFQLFCLIA